MMNLVLRKKRLFFACLLWVILLGVLAMEPDKVVKIFFRSSTARSFAHVLFYGVLGFLLCFYFRFKGKLGKMHLRNIHIVLLSFFLTGLCGGMTEIMQLWAPDRMAEWSDLGFDMIGAALGISAFYFYRRFLQWQHRT